MDGQHMKRTMDEKVKFGIISTANIANKVVAACLESPLIEVVAVGSRGIEKAKEFASKYSIKKAYASYEEVLDDPEVQVVYIPLPTAMHKEWVIKAANKGKHVLCEKPVAPTAEDVKEMIAACNKNNVQFMDGVMWVHANRTKTVKEYVEKHVGGVTGVSARFTWNMTDSGNIRAIKELEPLGALGDLGWYCIRAILFAFNYEMPIKVSGMSHFINEKTSGNQSFTGMMWFSDGRYGVFDCSFGIATRQSFEISGPLTSVSVNDFVVPFLSSPHNFGPTPNFTKNLEFQLVTFPGKSETVTVPADATQEQQMVDDMARIAMGGKVDPFWEEIALKTQIVLNALVKSSEEGAVVSL